MDWKKSITQSRKDAKNTSHGYAIPRLVGLTSKSSLDILATAAACVGLISPGRFFGRPLAVLAAIAAGLLAVFTAVGLAPQFILFGFANGALLRGIQVAVRRPVARLGAVLVCLGMLSAVFFHRSWSALAA